MTSRFQLSKDIKKFLDKNGTRRSTAIDTCSRVSHQPEQSQTIDSDVNDYDAGEASPALTGSRVNVLEYLHRLHKRKKKGRRATPLSEIKTAASSDLSPAPDCERDITSEGESDYLQEGGRVTERQLCNEVSSETEAPRTKRSAAAAWSPFGIAQRIQNIISGRGYLLTSMDPEPWPDDHASSSSNDGSLPATSQDQLIRALCSTTAMNGPKEGPADRSVWNALDHLLRRNIYTKENYCHQDLRGNRNSIMLYSPLVPDQSDAEVEVAQSGDDVEHCSKTACDARTLEGGINDVQVVYWIPSPTKISLQTFWWGYRLYLPPPVLTVLNDSQLEATKRAALIATALRWLLNHIPQSALPPQIQPMLFMLSGLIPVVGYLGGFIAWSWSSIKSFDRGNGVTLSATWLLPIALIPGTWHGSTETRDPS